MALFSNKLAPVVALAVVLLTVVGYLAVRGSGNDGLLGTTSPGMATLTVTRPTGGQINIGGYGGGNDVLRPE